MFDNCLINICYIFVKQWYIYNEYHIVHPDLCEILCKMKRYSNISNKCQFGTMSDPEGGVHLTKMSL